MQPGRMIHRLDVQQAVAGTAGTTGEQIDTWTTIRRDVPAQVRYMGASEQFRAKAVQSDATLVVQMRYDADITAAVRFKWGGRYLYPVSVTPDELNRWVTSLCREQL